VLKGTEWEDKWYFYHDALSQMTCKNTKEWMEKTGHIHKWILPMNTLSEGTIYARRPPGDSPECMPLDTVIFNDVHFGVNRQLMITEALHDTDTKKFSLVAPKRVTKSYLRVSHPVTGGIPSSEIILQDCMKWQVNLGVIREAGGAMVEGIGNPSGRRLLNVPRSTRGWGVRRENKPPKHTKWLHSDADGCVGLMVQKSIMTVKIKQGGEREVTIIDLLENDADSVNCALDDCEESVDNEDDYLDSDEVMADRFHVHEHDDAVVLGVLGLIDMAMFSDWMSICGPLINIIHF
jgi:hypothetical protein